MICFNIVCMFVFKHNYKKLKTRSTHFEKIVTKEIRRIVEGNQVSQHHIKYLTKKLKNIRLFLAFEHTINKLNTTTPSLANSYIKQIITVFEEIAINYYRKSPVKSAFYPYVVAKYNILKLKQSDHICSVLMNYMCKQNYYNRHNAIMAIFSSDDANLIFNAIYTLSQKHEKIKSKIICEGLLKYCGNQQVIGELLLQKISFFSHDIQVSIVDLCRLSECRFDTYIINLIKNELADDEVKFACIRYFTSKPCNEAYQLLYDFNDPLKVKRWEYVAISSRALANYPGLRTVETLKRNLYSSNWYIRLNSAEALKTLGIQYTDLIDVFEGTDRYAREIMQYHLDKKELAVAGSEKQ